MHPAELENIFREQKNSVMVYFDDHTDLHRSIDEYNRSTDSNGYVHPSFDTSRCSIKRPHRICKVAHDRVDMWCCSFIKPLTTTTVDKTVKH